MTIAQINDMLARLDETRAVSDAGHRSLPLLEEVSVFLKEILPLLEQVNDSIRDSTSTMPRATTQLENISQATEIAATEILDLVDAASARLGEITACYEQCIRCEQVLVEADERIMKILRAGLAGRDEELLAAVERLHAEREKMWARHTKLPPNVTNIITDLRSILCRITTSLQVQDITAQQIAAVNHLIESIRCRMDTTVQHLGIGYSHLSLASHHAGERASFDPDARYNRSPDLQAIADAVFSGDDAERKDLKELRRTKMIFETTPDSQTMNRPSRSLAEQTPGETATQDEIDRLFDDAL